MKTTAAILYRLNAPLVLAEIEIPRLKKGQVLIKMLASGICRSQINEITGSRGADPFLPHLLGHEGSARVVAVGSDVTKVKKGDFVVVSWLAGRGLEVPATSYLWQKQVVNSGAVATFTQYAVVSENRVTKISTRIPYDLAALLGCAITTGAGVIRHKLHIQPTSTLAVIGIGGIGSSVILGAGLYQPQKIIAIDINQSALRFAKKIGATHTLLFDPATLVKKVKKICPTGVDFVVEASGNKTAMETALAIVQNRGHVVIAGNLGVSDTIAVNPFELIKGKILSGTWGGETQPDIDFPFYVAEYLKGNLQLDLLISERVSLQNINSALEKMTKNRHRGRLIIDFQKYD